VGEKRGAGVEERGTGIVEKERGTGVEEERGTDMEAHAKDAEEGVQWWRMRRRVRGGRRTRRRSRHRRVWGK
jgi:hypothetical protein